MLFVQIASVLHLTKMQVTCIIELKPMNHLEELS